MGFVHPGIVEILNLDSFGPLKTLAGGGCMVVRRIVRLKCDGTHAETRFRLSAKRTSPFKSAV